MTFTNNTGIGRDMCVYLFVDEPGTIYLDCAQVEASQTASRYNLIENGDFRYSSSSSAYGWLHDKLTSADGRVTSVDTAAPTLDNHVGQITGDPNSIKHFYQEVQVSGNAGDSFVLSGWAKGDSAPLSAYDSRARDMGLYLCFNNWDGTYTNKIFHFNTDTNTEANWQYGAWAAVAEKDYKSINIDVRYDYNVNTAYFDGIQLYKEEFGNSYTYDDQGNVSSIVDLQAQRTDYEYDSNNNLTKILQDNKAKMTYTYDDHHNVMTATSEEGIVYSFTYDTYGNNTAVSIGSGSSKITATATYSTDGNCLVSTTDALGKTTTYDYDANTNVLNWVKYPEDTDATRTNYTYDTMYRIATAAATTDTGKSLTASYTYTDDLLTKLQTGSTTYNFTYGNFALRSNIKVGSRTLASYSYADRTNYLTALDYGNGDKVQYEYDQQGRVTKQTYEDGSTVTYKYDNNGALATVTDSESGISTTYYYDFTERLMKYVESGGGLSHSVGYTYDLQNNLTTIAETINGVEQKTRYGYDADNRISWINYDSVIANSYTYDSYGRISQTEREVNGTRSYLTDEYTYTSGGNGSATAQIYMHGIVTDSYAERFSYTYDDNGNILEIYDARKDRSYVYDSANQLIRENNEAGNFTHVWSYDSAGNILSRTEYAYTTGELGAPTDTVTYVYGNSDWGDLLTSYDGQTITSDTIGNMLTDGTWTYTWKQGRQLATMSNGTTTWTYTYNADGLRTKRTNGTTTYSYVYNGSQLTSMTAGNITLYFAYDASGRPSGLMYEGRGYHYLVNIQGDVIGLTDGFGNVVTEYIYDAWGNVLSCTGSMAATLGTLNPLRYRGYAYDTETGLYYLQSRYYDPEIGRFIYVTPQTKVCGIFVHVL